MPRDHHLINLVNRRFGHLVVTARHPENGPQGQPRWLCRCDCGNETVVNGQPLRRGKSRSCGCQRPGGYVKANGRIPLTQERLKEVLYYDPSTGIFTWKVTSSGRAIAGDQAGVIGKRGYRVITVDDKSYPAARLAWFYVHGEFPPELIDHIDGNRVNDRIENLRCASRSENMRNSAGYAASGLKGAYFNRRNGRWKSNIRINGHQKHLGSFDTKEEAHSAFMAKAREIYGDFASGRHRNRRTDA